MLDNYISDNVNELSKKLLYLISNETMDKSYNSITIFCIGTDRSTGDSYGPFVGTLLSEQLKQYDNIKLIGTLEDPVTANNIHEKINEIDNNSLIIAIDAALGLNPLTIKINNSPIYPGIAMNKNLPSVGHISIKGVINLNNSFEFITLQNTRLHNVIALAKATEQIILSTIKQFYKQEVLA